MTITETEVKRQVKVALLFNPDKYVRNVNDVDSELMFEDIVKKMNINLNAKWRKPVDEFLKIHISYQVRSMGFKYVV